MKGDISLNKTQNHICPLYRMDAALRIGTDQITIRCCCDFFTRKYISTIDNKLNSGTLADLIDSWETDLLLNELQIV